LDLIKGYKKWLEPMSAVQFVEFNTTRIGGSSRPAGWTEWCTFYILLFDATNRRDSQPTTVNIVFSPPKQFQQSNFKNSTKSFWLNFFLKSQGYPHVFIPQFFGQFFGGNLFFDD